MNTQSDRRYTIQKWTNVALCALVIFIGLGFCSSNKSLYLKAITEALGFKRSDYALATSCRFISTAVINIFFGYLVKRFGTKKLIIAGLVCLMASIYLNIIAKNIPMFCISECILGIGFSWTSTGMIGNVITNWCRENTGTITGATLAANGVGGAVAAQIVTPIIYDSVFGYRTAYKVVLVLLAFAIVAVALFFKSNPPAVSSDETAKKSKKDHHWVGISYDNVKRKRYFYGSILCIFLTGMCLNSVSGTSSTFFLDLGMDSSLVALVASVSSLALTGSKLFTGFMYDRFGLRKTMTICMGCSILTMILMAITKNSAVGVGLAFANAILTAVALPLETVMLPLYADDLFGDKSYSKIMGIVIAANTFGYAVGSPLINFCYDIFGSYAPAYFIAAGLMIIVLVLTQIVITSAHRTRNMIIANIKIHN